MLKNKKSKDWNFKTDDNICSFRAVGVLMRNGKVLVQKDNNEYALPGGHVKIGETAEETIVREFLEETGLNIKCQRMIWVDESLWSYNSKNVHSVEFYFLVDTYDTIEFSNFISQKDNCNIMLEWVNVNDVKNLNMYPDFIKDKITDISDGIEHFVYRE